VNGTVKVGQKHTTCRKWRLQCRFVLIIVFLRTASVNSIPLFKMFSREVSSSSNMLWTSGAHIRHNISR